MGKRGLGRGLEALLSESALPKANLVTEIPLDQIVPNPYQPRSQFDAQSIADLELSIREHGILQPILLNQIEPNKYQILAGERRYRAAESLGLTTIPSIVKSYSNRDMLEKALVENIQRSDISAIEAARAYKRMISEFGISQDQIAIRVGKSRPSISNILRLLQLPEEIQQSIELGEITEGHGRALLMAESADGMKMVWDVVKRRSLSVRETERLAREAKAHIGTTTPDRQPDVYTRPQTDQLEPQPNPVLRATEPFNARVVDDLQQTLQTRVSLKWTGSGIGKIEVEFYSEEDLARLFDLLLTIGHQLS